ncbi:hypothetical protein ACFWXB_13920 [Tsukamurella tyrosinosolvens]|uniref:hypothetical protein n=1 Tax=Tsukamurella tyrosinosolvens TaxID=57704 RepID=UPI002DD44F7F|nr:hypothetical protein [Tsukamurella tyrosinosolvens]MEC4612872.1 hypothetical protein [Tsukamurella tyrosinosolvens]
MNGVLAFLNGLCAEKVDFGEQVSVDPIAEDGVWGAEIGERSRLVVSKGVVSPAVFEELAAYGGRAIVLMMSSAADMFVFTEYVNGELVRRVAESQGVPLVDETQGAGDHLTERGGDGLSTQDRFVGLFTDASGVSLGLLGEGEFTEIVKPELLL